MLDWALPASAIRGFSINSSIPMPCRENGVAKRHVDTLGSKIAFYDINKGDYKL